MKKTLVAVLAGFAFMVPVAFGAGLVPCDGAIGLGGDNQRVCQACHLVQLGNNIITWLVGILTIVGAIMLAVAGLKMVTAGGNPGAISEAKETFTNIVVGFIIMLSAWLIVDTFMKMFVDGSKVGPWNTIECTAPLPGKTVDPIAQCEARGGIWNLSTGTCTGGTSTTTPPGTCTSCSPIPSGITVKSTACSGGGSCSVAGDLVPKLTSLDSKLDAAGINWQITEAYPPTRTHRDPCHAAGTCIDANCIGGCTAAQVKTFLESSSAAGLRAVYEVQTQDQKDALVRAGVNAGSVLVLGSWISAPHFSVYNQ